MSWRPGLILSLAMSVSLAGYGVSSTRWERVPAKDHARTNPMQGKPEATEAGALLYKDHCMACHKANAAGDGHKRPSLRSERIRKASDGDIEWFLRQGDLGRGMPSWSSLPEAQRWQVIAYLRSIQ
jgi:cytochrome c oxidase cbb3-type subunit 2